MKVKVIQVVGRRRDLTHEQFIRHVTTTHLDVVESVPEFRSRVKGYTQNHLLYDAQTSAGKTTLPLRVDADAILEIWWDDVEAIKQAFGAPMEVIRPDELCFGDVEGAWGVLGAAFAADPEIVAQMTDAAYLDASCTAAYLAVENPGAAEWLRRTSTPTGGSR